MQANYARLVKCAALAATLLATSLLIVKIFAWWYTGSVSLLAGLVDSLVDIAASLTNLLGVSYALQPADADHTFGQDKAESLAALAQGMFISGSVRAVSLSYRHPAYRLVRQIGVIVTVVALCSTLLLVAFQHWVMRKTRS
ncbi:Ferrous-iron efflux pump FieF|nr:Ferrous-iron efflux pump FieF [Candidatus Pantoea persica]